MKRLTALLVCFAMVAALCGCAGGSDPTTTPAPTFPEDPVAAYEEAAARLSALENVEMEVDYTEIMTVGADTFRTRSRKIVMLQGLGTEAFAAESSGTVLSGTASVTVRDVYRDGTLCTLLNSRGYRDEMTAEEYLDRLVPAVAVDADLYATVGWCGNGIVAFTDAAGLESWCDDPYADAATADATAELGADGLPSKFTYEASYTRGAADVFLAVTVQLRYPGEEEITLPPEADSYMTWQEDGAALADAVTMIYLAEGYLSQSAAAVSTSSEVLVSQAGGFSETAVTTLAAYGRDNATIGSFNTVYQYTDLSTGTTESITNTETYLDGVLTSVTDGGDPEVITDVTGYDMQDAVFSELQYLLPDISSITAFDLTVVGDTALLEYTFSDDYAAETEFGYCQTYFSDGNLLKDMATASTVNENSGYLGIDLTTGLPLALGQSFVMTHTIEGQDYILSAVCQKSVRLGAEEAYETVTGEALPAEAPEEQATPLFYRVTGEDGGQMWLLGTIHVGDERTARLPQEILDALASSDALAVEFDTEGYTQSLMEDEEAIAEYISAMLYTDGTTLGDHLGDSALYESTVALLKATGNYTNESVALLTRPVFQSQILQSFFMTNGYRLSSSYGVDARLQELAREQDIEIISVESGEFQMELLGDLSDELQELLLKQTVEYGQYAYNAETQALFEMWCRGDEAELTAYITAEEDDSGLSKQEKALYAEYENALGGMRNKDMLKLAKRYLRSGDTVFYAVGLAHLLADDGLVNSLRDAGYTVELVDFAE